MFPRTNTERVRKSTLAANAKQLHIKNESRAWGDEVSGARVSVRLSGRNDKSSLLTMDDQVQGNPLDAHAPQSLLPSLDHTAFAQCHGEDSVPVEGRIELLSVGIQVALALSRRKEGKTV